MFETFANFSPPLGMELLRGYGAKFNIADKYNHYGVLHYYAAKCDDLEVLDFLLHHTEPDNRPDINAKDDLGETPLHVLLSRTMIPADVLKAFIEAGADVNAEDRDSERPLQEACKGRNDANILQILLSSAHVTEIDDPDRHGRAALHQAAWTSTQESVQVLLDHNASPNVVDGHNRTPLFFACLESGSEAKALQILAALKLKDLKVGEINKLTKRGRTPLRQAAENGFKDVVTDLVAMVVSSEASEDHALLNQADDLKQRTPLHCAALRGEIECVRLLVDNGADVTLEDKHKKTALQLSISQWNLSGLKEYEEITYFLLDKVSEECLEDPEVASSAAANGSKRILQKLHEKLIKLDRTDSFGWTPLMLARRFGHRPVEAFLTRTNRLPSKWVDAPKEVQLSDADTTITHAVAYSRICLSTDIPIPPENSKFYYEITVTETEEFEQSKYSDIAVGFCTLGASALEYPGWEPSGRAPYARSWAYHGDDGGYGASSGTFIQDETRRYGPGDTIGCGVDFATNTIWFTKNGRMSDVTEFADVRGRLFPVLGMNGGAVKLETNFPGGKPFQWRDTDLVDDGVEALESKSATGISRGGLDTKAGALVE